MNLQQAASGSFTRNGSTSSPRLLVLGLDAADPMLIEKWCDEGILPTFRLLRKEGLWIPLRHHEPMPSAAVWPTIYTGTHPGHHGIYNGLQLKSGQQTVALVKPSDCNKKPFWSTLDGNGKRCIIMDVPFNYELKSFNGIQILDWGTYERHYEPHSLPDEILTNISKRFGAYPFGPELSRDVPRTVRHFQRVRSQLLAGVVLKGSVIKWLVSDRPWDFLMAVFCETHPAGHYFWSLNSNGTGKSPAAGAAEFTTTIKDIYRAVDGEIAKIISALDERITLLVLSGQGMGPNNATWHFIPQVLSKLGLLVTTSKDDRRRVAPTDWLGEMRDSIPLRWRRSVSRYLPGLIRDRLRVHWANAHIDWSRTRAFHLPTDQLGYIRINLKGREPHGIVEPGSEYHDICSRISEVVKTLVDPHTGSKLVREVFYTDHVFPGPQRGRLPDLIVAWNDQALLNAADSTEVGRLVGESPDLRSGNHKPQGFALFSGPGIQKKPISEARSVDIAPTILQYFGLHSSLESDDRPLAHVFS